MTISSHSVQFKKALTFSNSFNVMRMLCLPFHFSHFNHGSKEQRARTWRKTERKCSLNAVKSASRTMSTTAAAPSKANKAHGRLHKQPYLHIFTLCAVQKCARILKLFQRNAYALPSFSHFSHFICCTCITDQLKSTCHAY